MYVFEPSNLHHDLHVFFFFDLNLFEMAVYILN